MSAYRLFGSDTSPYSMKVRSFLRYKKADVDWVLRAQATEDEFRKHATQPTLPLLIDPKGKASQDSSNMLATLEKSLKEPAAWSDDPACAALGQVLEDYADEWLSKIMFHQRWSQSPDRDAAALRVLALVLSGKTPAQKSKAKASVITRMEDKLALVGATPENAPVLTASFRRFATLFNAHLEKHLYIFGGRPCFADFAIAAQLQQMLADPTPGEWLRDNAPFLTAWCEFMEDPRAGAPFATLEEVSETLLPIFKDEIAVTFLPWAEENSTALSKRKKSVEIKLADGAYAQTLQRYAAKSWREVKKAVAKDKKAKGLKEFLKAAGLKTLM